MKKTFSAFLILLVLAGPASAESFKRVVLYRDMAYLTVEKTASGGKVVVEAPPELIHDSLSVTPIQGGTVKSMSIEPKRLMSGRAKLIKDQLVSKKAELEGKKRLQKTMERQIELIFDSAQARDKEAAFSRTRMAEALSFIDERVSSLNQKHIALGSEIDAITLQVKDLEEALSSVSGKQGFEIAVETDAGRVVQVSYAVSNGSWRPEYAVYASPAKGEMKIESTAVIRQATGVDWEAEELSVATGRPGFGIQAPELFPWIIDVPRRYSQGMLREKSMMSAAPMEDAMDESMEAPVKETAASYVVGAARSVTLPGDGTERSVILQRKPLEAKIFRMSVPRADNGVFLRAETVWPGPSPILQGSYSAFVDGEFMGRGSLKQTQPGEQVGVDLGRDEGIKAERKEKVFHEKTLTGKDRTTYSYTITLKNTRKVPARLTLKDQIPLSRDESIKVDFIEATPSVKPNDEGILSWELDCAPGSTTTVAFSFSVTGMPPF